METKILFPHYLKRIGWIIAIPAFILGILVVFLDFQLAILDCKVFAIYSSGIDFFSRSTTFFGTIQNNVTDEVAAVLFLIGAILVAFSKEKQEDEFIVKTRLESLLWATYLNYAILLICFLFFYEFGFFYVMIFNLFTVLIFFIIRFYYILNAAKNSQSHEE